MSTAAELGTLVDNKYRLVRQLGVGGWGTVYEGENVRTLHRVAIKILHLEMSAKGDMVTRFEREAQAAGKIGSDHIIEVYDLGELPGGQRYMVMEFLEGEDLGRRLERVGPLPPEVLAPLLTQMLEGLGAAHDAGILHRDLKPENLYLTATRSGTDFVKILDFGISKFASTGPADMNVTRTGAVMGSPCYMSPEQARGSRVVDPRSDIYSLGVVLFECATGRLPHEGDNFNELLFKIALNDPPDPCAVNPHLDPDFAAIIQKAMARELNGRFANAAEFQAAVTAWMQDNDVVPSRAAVLRKLGRTPGDAQSSARHVRALADTVDGDALAHGSVTSQKLEPSGRSNTGGEQLERGSRKVTTAKPLPTESSTGVRPVVATPAAEPPPAKRRAWLHALPVLLALVVVAAVVLGKRAGGASTSAGPDPTAQPSASTGAVVTPTAPLASVAPSSTPADTGASAETLTPSASASAQEPAVPVAARGTTRTGAVTAAHGTGRAPATAPVASATAAAASSVPGGGSVPAGGTVEGRRIRTGL